MSDRARKRITLFDKEFEIVCNEEDIVALREIAKTLETQLSKMHGSENAKPPNIEKLAVVNCLNLIDQTQKLESEIDELADRTSEIVQKLETGGTLNLKR